MSSKKCMSDDNLAAFFVFFTGFVGTITAVCFLTVVINLFLLLIFSGDIDSCKINEKQYQLFNDTANRTQIFQVSILVSSGRYYEAVWIKKNYTYEGTKLPKNYTVGKSYKCHVSMDGKFTMNIDKYQKRINRVGIIIGVAVIVCCLIDSVYAMVICSCFYVAVSLDERPSAPLGAEANTIDYNPRTLKSYTEFDRDF